jgi:phosphotransferase system enzyme I (PtsP)
MTALVATPETSLLLTLAEISQLVAHSHHPAETLTNIVNLIHGRFACDVCSVYLLEAEQGELVLGATVGLQADSVGRVRMRLDEGLTGLVAERLAPVMVDDAFRHPRFKYFPEAGEDLYHSFLGVPLVAGGALQGVLVVQTRDPRTFSVNEIRLLVTVAAQLAPLVGDAHLLEQIVAAAHRTEAETQGDAADPASIVGISLSPGVGVGHAYLVNGGREWEGTLDRPGGSLAQEEQRLSDALGEARAEIARLSQRISLLVGEDHGAILQGQLMILQDGTIEDDLARALADGASAERALHETLQKYVEAFQKLTNSFFQQRVYDVKDVFRRILWHLRPESRTADPAGDRVVLVAHEASVMDLFSVDLDRLAGMVVELGGPQCHAAILGRSLGIPMIGQVPDVLNRLRPGRLLRVDGTSGRLEFDPAADAKDVSGFSMLSPSCSPIEIAAIPAGLPGLQANINLLCEVGPALEQGMEGVGLYRTEFLFLARRSLPTEDEQVGIYRKLFGRLGDRPATIRTFDLRPDKLAHCVQLPSALRHALDWRLVLESPPIQDLFRNQIRAIMRAACDGSARILVPLVTRTEQVDFVLRSVAQVRDELSTEGIEFVPDVPIGIMIEVAAAAALVDTWSQDVEFFALGTNDLLASALGIDREDPVGATINDPLNPGFLRLVRDTIESAHASNRRLTVCGEMAGDPEGTLALAALGVDALSVAVHQLQPVRNRLAGQTLGFIAGLADDLFRFRTATEVREFLRSAQSSSPF